MGGRICFSYKYSILLLKLNDVIVPVNLLKTIRNYLIIIQLSALKIVKNPGFSLWGTCGKGKWKKRPDLSTSLSTGLSTTFQQPF